MRGRVAKDNKRRASPSRCGLLRDSGPASIAGLLIAGMLLVPACRQAPRVSLPTPHGTVSAVHEHDAQHLAALLIDLQPRVLDLLPGSRDRSTDVWLGFEQLPADLRDRQGVVALTELPAGRILIGGGAQGVGKDFLLAHELVHALMDESWDPLPAIMKEGLCDAVASHVVPEQAARVRALRMFGARFAFGEQQLDLAVTEPSFGGRLGVPIRVAAAEIPRREPAEALRLGGHGVRVHDEFQDEDVLYGYGLLLVERAIERVGLEGLHALCVRARAEGRTLLTPDEVARTTGLEVSATAWRIALADAIGPAELEALTEQLGERLADAIVANLRYRYADFTAREFLERSAATVGLRGSPTELPLVLLPRFAEHVAAAWDAAPPHPLRPGETQLHGDRNGLKLGLFGSHDGPDGLTLQWLRVAGTLPDRLHALNVVHADPLQLPEGAEVEARMNFRRGLRGLALTSSRPGGFDQYRVEVHGVVVADLAWGLNVEVERDEHGWTAITSHLDPLLQPRSAVLFAEEANVLVSLRASSSGDGELRYPLAMPLLR